ncbi:acyltransferase [Pseudomonas sp.]|uniref:acyltransferase family protein n=1 Tax=Pseudomonas sp. TaxID=306 RepID=UPI001B2766ED|nr:acyltransferase [Pseudomonas sp.]MBO9548512.1 acyltransferase [Pseudomonas sp.]
MQGISKSAQRVSSLDGIRGWAALFVVMYHVFVQNFPSGSISSDFLGRLLPFRGNSAVFAFFIISGYALSIGYLRRNDFGVLARIAVGRYFRLVVPVALGCAVVYLFVASGLVITPARREAAGDISVVAHFAFIGAFSFDQTAAVRPIPQLWTMPYELVGSFLTLCFVFMLSRRSWRFYGYTAVFLALLAVQPIYAAFVAGIVLAESRTLIGDGRVNFNYSGLAFLGSALLLAFIPQVEYVVLVVLLSVVIVWSAVFNEGIQEFLDNSVSQFFGAISFPLYILHGVVIHSLGVWLHQVSDDSLPVWVVVNSVIVCACVVFARAFKWIDVMGIKFSHFVTRIVLPQKLQRVTIS